MEKYNYICTCGQTLTVEAGTREEAVTKLKEMMNDAAVAQHFAEKHPSEPAMPAVNFHGSIEAQTMKA